MLAGAGKGMAQSSRSGMRPVDVRGRRVAVHLVAADAQRGRTVVFAPGDGGWGGAAVEFARAMAAWGRDVYGIDTKQYLTAFTGKTTLSEGEIAGDMARIAESVSPGGKVTLVGWSEGAGLVVLAAARDKSRYAGVVTMGLADMNVRGWRWQDDLTSLIRTLPNEPTFSALREIPGVAPLPLAMIQSTGDQYVPAEEARRLFQAAGEPKKYVEVRAQNHRFDGGRPEFYRQLKAMLEWIDAPQR